MHPHLAQAFRRVLARLFGRPREAAGGDGGCGRRRAAGRVKGVLHAGHPAGEHVHLKGRHHTCGRGKQTRQRALRDGFITKHANYHTRRPPELICCVLACAFSLLN